MFPPKYVIAYPFGGRPVPVDWHLAVRALKMPTNSGITEICTRARQGEDGKWKWALEDAQTHLAEEAIRMKAKYILFIEDDTAPPPETIMELGRILDNSDESVMACGGIYTTRAKPPEPMVYINPGEGCFWNWKLGDVFECNYMGFGCMMLKVKVFELMPRPWFKEIRNSDDLKLYPELFPEEMVRRAGSRMSTDFFFFSKLKDLGLKLLAHGGVLPVHWDVETQTPYWLPKGSPPVKDILVNGKEYGWTDPSLELVTA